jgi:hypothetical protein
MLLPFIAFTILVLRYFYVLGALWGDGGALASIMWHNGWNLAVPRASGGGSFLATHMALVFWLSNALSWVLPLGRVQFFATFSGAVQALMALAVYWLLAPGGQRWAALVGAGALAVLFAFNGIVLAAARNPHFELLIIASGMMFLAALAARRFGVAAVFFALCLATREDAGGDLFLLLAPAVLVLRRQGAPGAMLRPLWGFAMLALAYSLVVIALQHMLLPGGDALGRVYLGWPPLQGITPLVIATRLTFYVMHRVYIWAPAIVALVLAERWRMPGLVVGVLACLPWAMLNLMAQSPYAGTLSNYYAFPFVFMLGWPLVYWRLAEGLGVEVRAECYVGAFVLMLAGSFIGLGSQQNPQAIYFPASFVDAPSLAQQSRTDRDMAALRRLAPLLGRVEVSGGVLALDPDHYLASQLVWSGRPGNADTVVFFDHGQDTGLALRAAQGLMLYEWPGTALRVATRQRAAARMLGLVAVNNRTGS